MTWFWMYGNELFILFLAPIVGLVLDYLLNRKQTLIVLYVTLFLLLPILTGYDYIIPYTYQFLGLITLSCLYRFYSKQIEKKGIKIFSAILISGLLLIILGFFSVMDSFSGFQKTEHTWRIKNYRIDYIMDQGFAGRPLMKYEISKYGIIPLFIKKADYSVNNDTTNPCIVHFTTLKMDFNKCTGTLKETD